VTGPGAGFVREARAADVADLARVQVASWRCAYASVVPESVLAELCAAEAIAAWEERWREAITNPPTSRHRVLVAVDEAPVSDSVSVSVSVSADVLAAAGSANALAAAGSGGAVDPGSGGAVDPGRAGGGRVITGFASAGPATDADRWPGTDAELYELRILPDRTRQGHGGRLLHAVADTLVEGGFHTAFTWALESDAALRGFLESSGWAPDGARAELDVGTRLPAIRLHTRISE
jgi:GNAT superfamily N-acetyltransferase